MPSAGRADTTSHWGAERLKGPNNHEERHGSTCQNHSPALDTAPFAFNVHPLGTPGMTKSVLQNRGVTERGYRYEVWAEEFGPDVNVVWAAAVRKR